MTGAVLSLGEWAGFLATLLVVVVFIVVLDWLKENDR